MTEKPEPPAADPTPGAMLEYYRARVAYDAEQGDTRNAQDVARFATLPLDQRVELVYHMVFAMMTNLTALADAIGFTVRSVSRARPPTN
jgi:hypothetical protein